MSVMLTPGPRLGPLPTLSPPARRRRWLLALAAMTTLLLIGWLLLPESSDSPDELRGYVLNGPRGPRCVRVVVGMDVSGSMQSFAQPRNQALTQLVVWSREPRTLRKTDELAVVDFAFDAATRSTPRPAHDGIDSTTTSTSDGTATLLRPLLEQVATFPASKCDTELLLLSDAQLSDLPKTSGDGNDLLNRYGIHDIRLLVPSDGISVPQEWNVAFPSASPEVFDGTDPDSTAIAFGHTLADLVGQRLEPRSP
ncbi:hypothetical protein [Actinophytocola oryzae]|uniref:VWFA domain-containing protein n=1 Tax=Actinophytocola oryzae TaxID=502181 RepID=A0A4R7UUL1_9PSEU|nr:hypothetical protein [Actinophytocola oryzae]TDV40130.1 hypothetical protein CLV71_124149 [Actinophytocola oryzae]